MRDSKQTLIRRLELGSNQAVAVVAAPGTIVRSLQGTIWLTQHALPHDYILVPGTRFVSASHGRIVLTSLDGDAVARVYAPGCGAPVHAGSGLELDPGVVARIEREARLARLDEIGRLLGVLAAQVASAWRSLARRFRHAAAQH